jgi:glycosyltransferase involved in cell wall biosynthesis
MSRRKILISAFSCHPDAGSEPGTGWACARTMARHHDVWVLTRARYRDLIEDALRREPVPALRFVYVDLPDRILRATKPSHQFQFFYYMWQFAAYFAARRLCREVGIDLIHHVTFVKFWAPSFLALLPVPFVWGPVGGGESMPRGFASRYSFRGRMYELLRDTARWIGEYDPFVRMTARRSAVPLATTNESAVRMRAIGGQGTTVYPAIGVTQEDLEVLDALASGNADVVRFLSIGRLIHWKGFDLGIAAFAKANPPDAEYWIVGDGPERKRLEDLASQLGMRARVKFFGQRTRTETLELLGQAHVLVHPSLHDSGGLVCLEALAARRPVICLDWGGPAVQVADGTGIRVGVRDPEQVTSDLAEAMKRLARDADLRAAMGEAGRRHVEVHYYWPRKVEHYCSIYKEVLAEAA